MVKKPNQDDTKNEEIPQQTDEQIKAAFQKKL